MRTGTIRAGTSPEIDESDCVPRGFGPFGDAFASYEIEMVLGAGDSLELTKEHDLRDSRGRRITPNRWIVVDKTAGTEVWRGKAPWTDRVVSFGLHAPTASTVIVTVYRKD